MKFVLTAAVLALAAVAAPPAAQAQVAAGAVPNTFDRPAQAAPAQAPAPVPVATAPANPQSEETLRSIIAGAQGGAMDYSTMTDTLAAEVRRQEATVTPIIRGFGPIQSVDFLTSREGADIFIITFANAVTEWRIGFDDAGKIDALLFRPAPTAPQ